MVRMLRLRASAAGFWTTIDEADPPRKRADQRSLALARQTEANVLLRMLQELNIPVPEGMDTPLDLEG